jgi:hypothetical protein
MKNFLYDEVDGLLVHRCQYCNAELEANNEDRLEELVINHESVVQCIKGY